MNPSFIHMVKWDFIFYLRYQIITIAVVITALYSFIFQLLPDNSDLLLTMLIFSDPTFLGFIFIGVIVLYEKSSNTLHALSVTPCKLKHYILAKVVSLTIVSVAIGFIMCVAGKGCSFDAGFMLLAISLSGALFVLLGIVGVSRVNTFNQYILIIPMFFLPAVFPLLELFGFYSSRLMYVVPTKASLLLFEASFSKVSYVEGIYAIAYLLIWIIGAYRWAYKSLLTNWK